VSRNKLVGVHEIFSPATSISVNYQRICSKSRSFIP